MGNIDLDKNDINRLNEFFESRKEEENYYVYMLCDNGVPFYVGKGIGTRCLHHELSLEEALREYSGEQFEDVSEEDISKELSEKQRKIQEAKNKNTFDVVIVKYGLSEQEAFMVESAVINALSFCSVNLTNIVNGHSSKKEKETGEPTKARYVTNFLEECCPTRIALKDIGNCLKSTSIPFDPDFDAIAFINFNDTYKLCQNDLDIWDAVRGCWRISEKNGKRTKYIFALHNNVIKGIFKVKRDGQKEADFQKIYSIEKNLPEIKSNIKVRKDDIARIAEVLKLLKDNPSIRGNAKAIAETLGEEKTFCERGAFLCHRDEFEKDEDLKKLRDYFINNCVDRSQLKMPQMSVKVMCLSDLD